MGIARGRYEYLSCGCAVYRSKGRARCAEALSLHRTFRTIEAVEWEAEANHGPASPERKEAMGQRILAYRKYTDHLRGLDETDETNETDVTNETNRVSERRVV